MLLYIAEQNAEKEKHYLKIVSPPEVITIAPIQGHNNSMIMLALRFPVSINNGGVVNKFGQSCQ